MSNTQPPILATAALDDGFTSIINIFEHRVGHACRAVVNQILSFLPDNLPPNPVIHDNACSTGAVTDGLSQLLPSARIYATDVPAEIATGVVLPTLQAYKSVLAKNEKWKRTVVEVSALDEQDLKFENDFFDVDILNFGIFLLPDPVKGVKEIYRTLKPGGMAIVTSWKEIGFKPLLWEVQKRIGPTNLLTGVPLMEPWCDGTLLKKQMEEGGFANVEMKLVEGRMWGIGMEDFQSVVVGNYLAMATKNNWTEEEKAKLAPTTAAVLEDSEAKFCMRDGDKVCVPMIAWAAVCTKPSA